MKTRQLNAYLRLPKIHSCESPQMYSLPQTRERSFARKEKISKINLFLRHLHGFSAPFPTFKEDFRGMKRTRG